MAISCWDKFTAIDWTTPTAWVARLTLVVLIICAVITWFTYEDYEDKVREQRVCRLLRVSVSIYNLQVVHIIRPF